MIIEQNLKILHWNARGILHKQHILLDLIQNYDIALINETWLHPNDTFILNNYSIIRADRNDPSKKKVVES